MKKRIVFLVLILMLITTSVIFAQDSDEGQIVITDALGREVVLDQHPQRIVLIGNGLTSVATAIYGFPEASEKIVGQPLVEQGAGDLTPLVNSNYEALTIFEGKGSTEEALKLNPDLVILKYYMREKFGVPFEELGIPVVYLSFEDEASYMQDFDTLGKIFDNEARANELKEYYINILSELKQLTSQIDEGEKPTVGFVYYSSKDGEVVFKVPPKSWIQTILIENAGGLPVWLDSNMSDSWATVNLEQYYIWQPEVIFMTAYFNDSHEVMEILKSSPDWQILDAVTDNQLIAFPIDFYYWDQSIPQWGITMQWIFDELYPGQSEFNFETATLDFYQFFYNMDSDTFYAEIYPLLVDYME